MTRLKWLWGKFWAWLTKPWAPEDVTGNPRGRRIVGDPVWMIQAAQLMRYVNAGMIAVIIVSLMLLAAVKQ
jgi:hypothetical protein